MTAHAQPPTILVLDDEPALRRAVARLLTRAGYRVVVAANGSEAIALVRDPAHRIDALVSDVVMPDACGPDVAQAIWALLPDLPVIFVSGSTQGLTVPGPLLAKPFRGESLVALVDLAVLAA